MQMADQTHDTNERYESRPVARGLVERSQVFLWQNQRVEAMEVRVVRVDQSIFLYVVEVICESRGLCIVSQIDVFFGY